MSESDRRGSGSRSPRTVRRSLFLVKHARRVTRGRGEWEDGACGGPGLPASCDTARILQYASRLALPTPFSENHLPFTIYDSLAAGPSGPSMETHFPFPISKSRVPCHSPSSLALQLRTQNSQNSEREVIRQGNACENPAARVASQGIRSEPEAPLLPALVG